MQTLITDTDRWAMAGRLALGIILVAVLTVIIWGVCNLIVEWLERRSAEREPMPDDALVVQQGRAGQFYVIDGNTGMIVFESESREVAKHERDRRALDHYRRERQRRREADTPPFFRLHGRRYR